MVFIAVYYCLFFVSSVHMFPIILWIINSLNVACMYGNAFKHWPIVFPARKIGKYSVESATHNITILYITYCRYWSLDSYYMSHRIRCFFLLVAQTILFFYCSMFGAFTSNMYLSKCMYFTKRHQLNYCHRKYCFVKGDFLIGKIGLALKCSP